jgi:VanZ like family
VAGERLPLQRRDRPGFAPGSLTVLLIGGRAYHRTVAGTLARLWLPVLAWAALIFALSSIPDLGTGLGGWDLALRKLAHAAEYAVLGALLVRATGRAGLALAAGTLYAVSDELHQALVPGRMGSPVDVAIDALGVACGVVLWQAVRSRRLA